MTTTHSTPARRGIFPFAKAIALAAAFAFALVGCGGGGGTSAAAPAASTPPAAPASGPLPVVQIALSASTVAVNQTSTLTWSSTNATSCTASGAWSGTQALAGSLAVSKAAAGSYTYGISCTGTGGTTTAATTLTVVAAPTIQIALSPSQVTVNQPSTLTWSATNASSCTASGAWAGTQATSGSLSVSQAAVGNYTYSLSCAGGGGSISTSASLSVVAALSSNAVAITVDLGPNGASFNMPFVSVTVCQPGTTVCQTVDHVQLDTGSYGLRLLASAMNPTTLAVLPPVNTAQGTPVGECEQFVSGYTWGSVRRADIKLSGETALALPVQIVADQASPYTNVPGSCSSVGNDLGTVTSLGANGILGVGLFNQDCAPCATTPISGRYYACTPSGCTSIVLPLTSQVANPVAAFSVDNNGVALVLPSVPPGGANSLTGTLVFGIGTQANNQLGSATVYATDSSGNFTTTYNHTAYNESFIDSGSNGLFFDDSSIPVCSSSAAPGFYCPASTLSLSAINTSATGAASGTVKFTVENIVSLANSVAAANVGGTGLTTGFDWGLPFFFGRTVFVAIKGASTPGGNGPYWAY